MPPRVRSKHDVDDKTLARTPMSGKVHAYEVDGYTVTTNLVPADFAKWKRTPEQWATYLRSLVIMGYGRKVAE